ncbi:glycosyltransferase [archaeon]|jgi:glycosyltransferase involved in cell wall biosynthesis|nr:glycosyltransferase [archaeon]
MKIEEDKISIILPSYNYAWCIKETIDSVLNQDYENWELVIVDDGSQDNSPKILQNYQKKHPKKIKLFFHSNMENKGMTESYKLGIKNSTGKYLAFIESDDIWYPNYLSSKIKIFKENREVILVYNNVEMFGSKKKIEEGEELMKFILDDFKIKNKPFYAFEFLSEINYIPTFSCFMVKAKMLNKIDFSDKHKAWLDWWILGQLSVRGKFFFQDKKKTKWRMHEKSYNNLYISNLDIQNATKKMQEDILDSAVDYLNKIDKFKSKETF